MSALTDEGFTDLGHGCAFKFYGPPDSPAGIWFRFPSSDPDWPYHTGRVPFSGEGPTWTVESLDPLTVSPSILSDRGGGDSVHGHIRDGRWVPC